MIIEKRKLYFGISIVIVLAVVSFLYFNGVGSIQEKTSGPSLLEAQARFSVLNNARTNLCAPPSAIYNQNSEYLQGSCCAPMVLEQYEKQLEELKEYSDIDAIPKDPYNVSFALAQRLLGYEDNIKLNSEQQKIYDGAVEMSEDNGPCCCKCWRWYAFEGLAKYLITEYNYNSAQIAEVWESVDGCGGSS